MRRTRSWSYVTGVARPMYEVEQTMTVEQAKEVLKNKVGLSDVTITYLYNYRWGDDLLCKLALAVEGST